MKRPGIVLLLFLLYTSAVTYGQSPYLDSLRLAVVEMAEDSIKVDILNELAVNLLRKDYTATMEYTGQAVLLAQNLGYEKGRAKALRNRSDLYSTSGLFDQATQDALASLKIFEKLNDSAGMSSSLTSLGVISFYMHETDPAIEYYDKARRIHQDRGNERGMLSVQNNIASALASAGRYEEALVYYQLNLKALQTIPIARLEGITLNNIGGIYQQMNRSADALPYFIRAEKLYVKQGDQLGLSGVYQNLAEANVVLGNFGEAERYIGMSEELAKSSGSPARQLEIINFRSKLAENKGQYREALTLYKDYTKEKAKLANAGQSDKVAKLRTAFEADKKVNQVTQERDLNAAQLARQNAENRNQRLLIYSFILGFILLLVLVILQIRNNGIRKKINAELVEQKQVIEAKNQSLQEAKSVIERMNRQLQTSNVNLEATVEERTEELSVANSNLLEANENLDTFIYRASHDLRGPLGRIKGLANVVRIQEDQPSAAPYVDMMNVACDRMDQVLRKLILVREIPRLEHSIQKIDMPDLIDQVKGSLLRLEDFGTFDVKLQTGQHGFLNQDPKRVRIVLENLLENAYIFRKDKANKTAEATVKFHRFGGYFFIEVEDEGIGIDPEYQDKVFDLFFRGSNRSTGNGVGLFLVSEAVGSMQGKLDFTSELGKYSRFRVGLKDLG